MIGIFWFYKGHVLGRVRDTSEGEERVPGLIDSPDNHADFWEYDKKYLNHYSELSSCEYLAIPRGRVLYSKKDGQTIIYMDKTLFTDSIKKKIKDFFGLNDKTVVWRTDPHYTTAHHEIERLFE